MDEVFDGTTAEMWARKRERIKLLPKTKAYALNPARDYERHAEMVLRGVAKFLARSGFCPTTEALARKHTWITKGTQSYCEDLAEMGYLEVHLGKVWNPTEKGWATLGIKPVEPLLPPQMTVSVSSMREAKAVARRLADPEIAAAYVAHTKHAEKLVKPQHSVSGQKEEA